MFVFETRELALKHVKIVSNILQIIDSKEFFYDLKEIGSFWNCDESGEEIHGILSDSWMYPATVVTMGWKRFKPWYRNTTAETNGKVIELNPKFMNRSEKDVANTLVHEWLHTRGFGHIWNSYTKHPIILTSVNYVVGNLVEIHYGGKYGDR